MKDIYLIPPEKLGQGSNIKLNVCEHEVDMYWKVAIEVLETIEEKNKKGEPTLMVVPYGPIGPYSRLVYLINKYRVSLKNCTFINMDEYLTDDGEYIDKNDPLSFRGGMDRIFYSQIDEELNGKKIWWKFFQQDTTEERNNDDQAHTHNEQPTSNQIDQLELNSH